MRPSLCPVRPRGRCTGGGSAAAPVAGLQGLLLRNQPQRSPEAHTSWPTSTARPCSRFAFRVPGTEPWAGTILLWLPALVRTAWPPSAARAGEPRGRSMPSGNRSFRSCCHVLGEGWCVVPRGVTRLQDGEYLSGLLGRAHPEEAVVFVLQPGHHATVEDREVMVGQLPTQGVRRRVRWNRFIRFPVASSACTIFSQGLNHSRPRSSPESRSRTGGPRSPCRHACASPEARRCRGDGGRGR